MVLALLLVVSKRTRLRKKINSKIFNPGCIGDHAMSLPDPGYMIALLARIQNKFVSARWYQMVSAQFGATYEQRPLLPDNNSRSVKIYLALGIAGQPAALDVTITWQPCLIAYAAGECGFLCFPCEKNYEQYAHNCSGVHWFEFVEMHCVKSNSLRWLRVVWRKFITIRRTRNGCL